MNAQTKADSLVSDYLNFLRSEIAVSEVGEYTEITYPFLDRYNDYLQIYIKSLGNDRYELTDDAYIMNNLEMSGVKMTPARKKIAESVARSFRVDIKNGSLVMTTTKQSLANHQHLLLQCMLKLDDLYYLSRQNVRSAFQEDIKAYLDSRDIGYTQSVFLVGKSGLPYKYDFLFQKTKRRPSIFCVAHNKLDVAQTKMLLFDWQDIHMNREDRQLLVVYNGQVSQPEKGMQILKEYDIRTIDFENKDEFLDAVA